MKKNPCPKCFSLLSQAECIYVCNNSKCSAFTDQVRGADTARGLFAPPSCKGCGQRYTECICPDCGYPQPMPNKMKALSVSLVGASGAGKSNYFAVLLHQLKTGAGKELGCALHPFGGDNTINTYDNVYYRPLFVSGHCVQSTGEESIEPLEYALVFDSGPHKSCEITFYDSVGSDFEDLAQMQRSSKSLYNSQGLMMVIDPSQFPVIRDILAAGGRPVLDNDPVPVLSRIVKLVRTATGNHDPAKKIQIPLAICITKLDTVRQLLDPASFVRASSRHLRAGGFDAMDMQSCDTEMRSLIESWGGGELLTQISTQFARHAFFGLSALGAPPNEHGQIPHISPHRTLDPLLWLLHAHGIVRK